MSVQTIRGGRSLGVAMEMFEYFKSDMINRASRHNEVGGYIEYRYVPAGTAEDHFTQVALALSGSLCEMRVHDVEREVPEIDYRNRRVIEFLVKHEGHDDSLRRVHFKLTMIQPCGGGVWGFLGAQLTDERDGQKIITRYAMRKSVTPFNQPHLLCPRQIVAPGIHNTWWIIGMNCPIYMVSQEVAGEAPNTLTMHEMMEIVSEANDC